MRSSSRRSHKASTHNPRTTLWLALAFFAATCAVGTIGYVLAGWHWIDAVYMVTITIFGVGYSEVKPIDDPWLKLFTMGVILAGCSSLIYVVGGIVQMLAEGEVRRMLGVRNRSREIGQLSDHTIICGYGRVGQMLAAELASQGQSLVIIDREGPRVKKALADGFLAVEGDAVEDETLHRAGLYQATTLATVLPDDATNVFITLTARDLSETIRIIARAEAPCTERKLIRSGATNVVMPAAMGAIRIAQLASVQCDHDAAIPEDRYRILSSKSREINQDQPAEDCAEQAVENDIEELANLASDLSRSVAERRQDQLSESDA